jgi:hypothetical protein
MSWSRLEPQETPFAFSHPPTWLALAQSRSSETLGGLAVTDPVRAEASLCVPFATPLRSSGASSHKTPFYLKASQVTQWDDLAHDHKKQAGQRINRNDSVRQLIDRATLDSCADITSLPKKQGQK